MKVIKAHVIRKLLPPLMAAAVMICGLCACSNNEVDTAKLQSVFQSARQDVREELNQGIASVNSSNYSAALPLLQHVAYSTKLTDEQRLAIEDSIKKVKARLAKNK